MLDFKRPLLFFGSITLAGLILWLCSWVIDRSQIPYAMYRHSFVQYHTLAYKMYRAKKTSKKLVLLVGISATRELFDGERLASEHPDTEVINLGLGGFEGMSHALDLIARLLTRFDVRPDRVILGLHPFYLAAGDTSIESSNLSDFLTFSSDSEYIALEERKNQAKLAERMILNDIFPLAKFGRQASRLVRLSLFRINHLLFWRRQAELSEFEAFGGELKATIPWTQYLYPDSMKNPADPNAGVAKFINRWIDERRFSVDPASEQNLKRAIETLRSICKNQLIILRLPTHSVVRRDPRFDLSRDRLDLILKQVKETHGKIVRTADWSEALPDSDFFDGSHVFQSGRARITESLTSGSYRDMLSF